MTAFLVSDAHMDTQWNWDVQATIRHHIKKTLDQNLFLLKQYPNYVFNFEGAQKYAWMKEYYPREYEEVKRYVRQDRWHITGSSWDANETIICSPESWIRNILLGQRFYRQEFKEECNDIFLPDCFGFGYTMPTLAAHCNLIGFSSQKLQWRTNPFYADGKKYPFTIGLWKGIDGSPIVMVHGFDYNHRLHGDDLTRDEGLMKEIKESPLNMVYRYYGTGDTGGSPDIESVKNVMKALDGDGPIKVISSRSNTIYNRFLPFSSHPELPVYDGELTMDVHGNGCYTSQAAMKLYNRQNEHLGDAAERAAVIADWLGEATYPLKEMTGNWQRMIWHQFHDDLPGTCIPRAYEFSWNDELITLSRFSSVLTNSVGALARNMDTRVKGTPVVLYNNESFEASTLADIPVDSWTEYEVLNQKGKKVASQTTVDDKGKLHLLFTADVPSTGAAVYSFAPTKVTFRPIKPEIYHDIENSVYRLTVNAQGDITSIVDKRCGKELVAPGKTMGLVVFDDCESYAWPAWEILKKTIDRQPVGVKDNVKILRTENGSLRKTLRIEKTYGQSTFIQYIHLYEGPLADRIDFRNEVEWQSLNALLKMNFPMNIANEKATYDLGLGSIERGNNTDTAFEVYAHEWTDLTDADGSYGVTIMNDSKYGWDKPDDNTLRLSLLYSPKVRRNYTYQERQDFGHHEFTFTLTGHQGTLDKTVAVQQSTLLNSPLRAFWSPKHDGKLGREYSFMSCDNPNVTVRALKKAEDGDNEYIVRVYENTGQPQKATLSFDGKVDQIFEADGTEVQGLRVYQAGKKINIEINGYGVRTYRILMGRPYPEAPKAQFVELPYNKKCFTFNGFRNAASFEGGYSYAAELMEKTLRVDNVAFRFGPMDGNNGVACKGQTIQLPAEGDYNRVYFLAASAKDDRQAGITIGTDLMLCTIPSYTGFIGQWGHTGQTTGYFKPQRIAYVGTHRHSATGDEPYEFTYMFKYGADVSKGATITLPDDPDIVIFAMTVIKEGYQVEPLGRHFTTGNAVSQANEEAEEKESLLKGAKPVDVSGEVNRRELATNLTDGNPETKWCDITPTPNYVVFDMGAEKPLTGWKLINAGIESAEMITRTCLLQVRTTTTEDWKTVDMVDGNKKNEFTRLLSDVKARYVRLYVVSPTQGTGKDATRIYEFEVYGD